MIVEFVLSLSLVLRSLWILVTRLGFIIQIFPIDDSLAIDLCSKEICSGQFGVVVVWFVTRLDHDDFNKGPSTQKGKVVLPIKRFSFKGDRAIEKKLWYTVWTCKSYIQDFCSISINSIMFDMHAT